MPVAEKCDEIISEMNLDEWVSEMYIALSTINIDILYNTIVEFIQWYNQNKDGNS